MKHCVFSTCTFRWLLVKKSSSLIWQNRCTLADYSPVVRAWMLHRNQTTATRRHLPSHASHRGALSPPLCGKRSHQVASSTWASPPHWSLRPAASASAETQFKCSSSASDIIRTEIKQTHWNFYSSFYPKQVTREREHWGLNHRPCSTHWATVQHRISSRVWRTLLIKWIIILVQFTLRAQSPDHTCCDDVHLKDLQQGQSTDHTASRSWFRLEESSPT